MNIDLSKATKVPLTAPDVQDAAPDPISSGVAGAIDVPLAPAPVSEAPLSGKEKAGVSLTWGVLVILAAFILAVLLVVWDYETDNTLSELIEDTQLKPVETFTDETKLQPIIAQLEEQRESYRSFIRELVQMILLNVIFPILTALLGYVFGTTRQDKSTQGDGGT